MKNIELYNLETRNKEKIDLSNFNVFNTQYNEPLVHQSIVSNLNNKRQGTKSTLTRAEVSGGGAKPYRQKGTGRARQGSIRAPQFRKGGVVFAPKPRLFKSKLNVTFKRNALFSALSRKMIQEEIILVSKFNIEQPKTKLLNNMIQDILKQFNLTNIKSILLITSTYDKKNILACRNLKNINISCVNNLNTYDVVRHKIIICEKEALEILNRRYNNE